MRIKLPRIISRENFSVVTVSELIFQIRAEEEDYPDASPQRLALQGYIAAASSWVEKYTGHLMVGANVELSFDSFPAGSLELPVYPVREVVSVNYLIGGASQSIALSEINADLLALRPRLVSRNGWPAVDDSFNAITVTVKAGYAAAESVPETLKAAVLMMASHLFENSSATTPVKLEEVPLGVRALADSEKVSWI